MNFFQKKKCVNNTFVYKTKNKTNEHNASGKVFKVHGIKNV